MTQIPDSTPQDRGLVAITGANGTIGFECVCLAARIGYRVRCIVRRETAKANILSGPFLPVLLPRVEFAYVPDNTVPGAYDDALKGADYVVHIAGVWPKPTYHPDDEVYYPFVKSMENVVSAATKSGTVRRVVFTQAGAALVNPNEGDTLGTRMEKILNESVELDRTSVSLRPPLKTPHHAYCAAKAYCMDYLQSIKDTVPFDIVQVIPGTVIGPSPVITTASEAYANMDRMSRALLFNDVSPRYAFGFVSRGDCAAVHVNALDEEKLPSNDIPKWLIAAAPTSPSDTAESIWKSVGDMIEDFKTEIDKGVFTVGRSNLPINMPFRVDSRWTENHVLGQEFTGFETCVRDVALWYRDLVERERISSE